MKAMKKIIAVLISLLFVALCFSGCSSSEIAEVITDKTMLIAYTRENKPFIYTDDNGNLTGFDVKLMDKIFKSVKNDYKNYKFIQVDENYKVGEDIAYTDDAGNEYIADVMVGGIIKNEGSFNKDYTFTADIIDNRIIAVTADNSKIKTYADLKGAKAGIVSDNAKIAMDKNTAVKDGMKNIKDYKADTATAFSDLKAGKIDVLVIDEFRFNTAQGKDDFRVLNGELDTISYVYSFKKWESYDDTFNEAIYELKSTEYNDADEFTPIVEECFGYNASSFDYEPAPTK